MFAVGRQSQRPDQVRRRAGSNIRSRSAASRCIPATSSSATPTAWWSSSARRRHRWCRARKKVDDETQRIAAIKEGKTLRPVARRRAARRGRPQGRRNAVSHIPLPRDRRGPGAAGTRTPARTRGDLRRQDAERRRHGRAVQRHDPPSIIVRYSKVGAAAMDAAPCLRVDLQARQRHRHDRQGRCQARGIEVVAAAGANAAAVAEQALALMLACAKSVVSLDARMHGGHWDKATHKSLELDGRTVGAGRSGCDRPALRADRQCPRHACDRLRSVRQDRADDVRLGGPGDDLA